MIREEEPMKDLKINLKQKNENSYDDDNLKPKHLIFDDDIVNIQLVGNEIAINKTDEDIGIIKIII